MARWPEAQTPIETIETSPSKSEISTSDAINKWEQEARVARDTKLTEQNDPKEKLHFTPKALTEQLAKDLKNIDSVGEVLSQWDSPDIIGDIQDTFKEIDKEDLNQKQKELLQNPEDIIKNWEKNVEWTNKLIDLFGKDSFIGKLLAMFLWDPLKEKLEWNKDQLAMNKFKELSEAWKFNNTPLHGQIWQEIIDMNPKELDDFFDTMRDQWIDLSKDKAWENLLNSNNSTYANAREKITSVLSELNSNPTKKDIASQLNSTKEIYAEEESQKAEQKIEQVVKVNWEAETET